MNKLNGIFQALESHNYKNSLKLCNAFLEKQKKGDSHTSLVCVLKALSLSNLGELDEAIKVADSVAFLGHADDNIISNLNYFYRSINQLDKMCKVWEASFKKHKTDNFAEGLFLSFSKVRDLKGQKEYAVILSKDFPSSKHSFWYLMTLLILALKNPSSLNLQLTERLADKLATEGKFKTTEELYMYETILETQNKYQKYLEIMKGKLGDLYTYQPDKLKQFAKIYEKLEMYKDASDCYKEIITKYEPDEWSCYIGYFNCMDKIEGTDMNEVCQWIKSQQANMNQAKPIRAPFIAELEFSKRQKVKLDDLIVSYFKRFGTKPICFYDLKSYLVEYESLPAEQRQQLIEILKQQLVAEAEVTPKGSSDRVLQLSNIYRIHRALGLQYGIPADEKDKLISMLLDEYEKNRVATAATQQISERLSGDDLVMLCYQLLLDDNTESSLARAASILEYGHKSSPKNFQFNLGLIRIYFKLGATSLAYKHVKIVNLKNIQWDTMAWFMFDELLRGAAYTELFTSLEKSSKFYTENESTPDFIAQCFHNESYTKVIEIEKFQDRVANSFQRAANLTESQLLNFFIAQHKHHDQPNDRLGQFNSIPSGAYQLPSDEERAAYTFNQDLQVQDFWNSSTYKPAADPTTAPGTSSFTWNSSQQTLITQLIRRRLTLALLVASKITVNPTKGPSPVAANYADLLEKLTQLLTGSSSSAPVECDFNQHVNAATAQLFIIYNSVRTQLSSSSITLDNIELNVQSLFNKLMDSIKAMCMVLTGTSDASKTRMLTTHLELMTWVMFVFSELNKVIPPKKQKKKDEVQVELRKRFDQLVKDLQTVAIKDVETNLTSLENQLSKLKLSNNNTQPTFIDITGLLSTVEENSLQIKKQISSYLTTLNSLSKFE